jgi:hypothetical protein
MGLAGEVTSRSVAVEPRRRLRLRRLIGDELGDSVSDRLDQLVRDGTSSLPHNADEFVHLGFPPSFVVVAIRCLTSPPS